MVCVSTSAQVERKVWRDSQAFKTGERVTNLFVTYTGIILLVIMDTCTFQLQN